MEAWVIDMIEGKVGCGQVFDDSQIKFELGWGPDIMFHNSDEISRGSCDKTRSATFGTLEEMPFFCQPFVGANNT